MPNLSLRGVDEEMTEQLRAVAEREGASMNKVAIRALRRGLGLEDKEPKRYRDVSCLAGLWTAEESKTFASNTAIFERIDEELWR